MLTEYSSNRNNINNDDDTCPDSLIIHSTSIYGPPYDVPDTVLSVWDTPVNDASKIPGLLQPALGEVGGQKINSSIKNK